MSEYLVLEQEDISRMAQAELKDDKGRRVKPARKAQSEIQVGIRLDRQFSASLHLPKDQATGPNRQKAIAEACSRFHLGEELAPGLQVIEVETQLLNAQDGELVLTELRDDAGNITRPEKYREGRPEEVIVSFTLRRNGSDIVKVALKKEDVETPGWEDALISRLPASEVFVR